MLHVATNDIIFKLSGFYNGLKNRMLKEAVDLLKDRNETRRLENFIVGFLFNQMLTKKGSRKHGAKAVAVSLKEFTQPHDNDTFETIDPMKLSHKQRRTLTNAISVIKENEISP